MTEHRPESAQRDDPLAALPRLTLPKIPTVYALHHPEDGLAAWVFVMPGGLALIVSLNEDGEESGALIKTSLDKVVSFWAPRDDADLVRVAV
ncbi:MAG: hypothetical protein WCF33_05940 [Pseudonocardiaceae bacterium]